MMVIYSISFEIACVGLILTSEECWMVVVQVCIILIITFLATFSVVTGLRAGLKTMSQITFTLGNILLFSLLFLDNTWCV
jgi:choline/glycine/proline betaine transport protein